MRLLAGKWIVSAIATAAKLELVEHLEEPKTIEHLARCCDLHPPSLRRLVGVLVGEGLLTYVDAEHVAVTALGRELRRDRLGVLAQFVGSASQWTPWVHLEYSVRTGQAAFEKEHGEPLFTYLEHHPDESRLYDTAVDAFTRQQARALAETNVLEYASTVVDVGGGRGTFLMELLLRHPRLRGILFDKPNVVGAVTERFAEAGLSERTELVGGDFHGGVPAGADCYVIKHVLHNWDDDRARGLLKHCADAVSPKGKVLVVEGIALPGNMRDGTKLMDLEMLVLTGGGRERSKPEFRRLFADVGLRLESVTRLSEGAWVMVGTRSADRI
jgi:O-methyltransferase domain